MAKKLKEIEDIAEEVVLVEEAVEESTIVLNESVPEKEAPGHNSRDFSK